MDENIIPLDVVVATVESVDWIYALAFGISASATLLLIGVILHTYLRGKDYRRDLPPTILLSLLSVLCGCIIYFAATAIILGASGNFQAHGPFPGTPTSSTSQAEAGVVVAVEEELGIEMSENTAERLLLDISPALDATPEEVIRFGTATFLVDGSETQYQLAWYAGEWVLLTGDLIGPADPSLVGSTE